MKPLDCLILEGLLILACTACKNNTEDANYNQAPIVCTALIDGMTTQEAAHRFRGGDGVGMYISSTDASASAQLENADVAQNALFAQSAGGLVPDKEIVWGNHTRLTFHGYYPYDRDVKGQTDNYPFAVSLRQDTAATNNTGNRPDDFLWSRQTTDHPGEMVQLSFHHLMSKVVIHIKNASASSGHLIGSQLKVCGTRTHARIHLGNGSVTPEGTTADISTSTPTEIPQGYEAAAEAILVPQTISTGIPFLEITTKGNTVRQWNTDQILTFAPGKQTTLEVTVKDKEVEVRIKEISDWKESGYTITGEALQDYPTMHLFDFYNRNGVQGIVIHVDESGKHGWLASTDEITGETANWCISEEYSTSHSPEATNRDDAMANLQSVLAIDPTLKNYPAMQWCNAKNTEGVTGWVLPAINTLTLFTDLLFQSGDITNLQRFNEAVNNSPVGKEKKKEVSIETDAFMEFCYLSSTLASQWGMMMVYYNGFTTDYGTPFSDIAYTREGKIDQFNVYPEYSTYRVRAFHPF